MLPVCTFAKSFLMRRLSGIFKNKPILYGSAGGILATIIICLSVSYINRLKEPVVPAEYAIPANTSWYIKLNNAAGLFQDVVHNSTIGAELQNFPFLNNIFLQAGKTDSMLNTDAYSAELLAGKAVYICCTYENDSARYLLLANLPDTRQGNKIHRLIKRLYPKHLEILERNAGDAAYHACNMHGGQWFFYSVYKGIFLYSRSEPLLASALQQVQQGAPLQAQQDFSAVHATSGKNVNGNMYFRIPDIMRVMNARTIALPFSDAMNFLSQLGSWAGLDLVLKDDEIHLNGYINAEENDFLREVFSGSQPQKAELTRIIPFNTAFMLYLGTDDFGAYMNRRSSFLRQKGNDTQYKAIQSINASCACEVTSIIDSWIGNEAALVITETRSGNFRQSTYGVFRTNNRQAARAGLLEISEPSAGSALQDDRNDSIEIRRIPYPEFFSATFGNMFSVLSENYYMFLGNYLIAANSPEALRIFSSAYFSGKSLDKNENYAAFADHVSDYATICLYLNIRKSIGLLANFLNAELRRELKPYTSTLRNFQAFAIQIVPEKNMFCSNIYLKYNPTYKDENPAVWETQLDTFLYGKPYILSDGASNSHVVIVFDKLNQMYLIDNLGRIAWKIQLPEPPEGDVFAVDRYKNNTTQLVFNTKHHIFMLGMDGAPLPGFPTALPAPASCGLAVFDYENNRNYRLLLACENGRIYNYSSEGKAVPGWSNPIMPELITEPLVHIRMLQKDYLIATDESGRGHFLDRRGKYIFKPSQHALPKSPHSTYYVFADGARSKIITSDQKGHIIRTDASGKRDVLIFGRFSNSHWFIYDDYDGNGNKNFIICDSNMLRVFSVNKKLLYKKELPAVPDFGLVRIDRTKKNPVFGVVLQDSAKVYLFTKAGPLEINRYLEGASPFATGPLDKGGMLSLIVARDKTVFNYIVPLQ
jgi:hypothetical protein